MHTRTIRLHASSVVYRCICTFAHVRAALPSLTRLPKNHINVSIDQTLHTTKTCITQKAFDHKGPVAFFAYEDRSP
ncbi:hypothetical protein DEU56DRAFT_40983 [Suillus clintonianus]|uniref:uncharacterized protein n=1 Tax=Suillus clintonianus TaxID=1904413 RepID=UPI001B878133|nr:uncharacterized protein DEU56DRAFT_40983 [Suillus clintonianus]KAG2124057.1 hypothetical protein DEU56DRAFT_40983 [Suillus clintonianus]